MTEFVQVDRLAECEKDRDALAKRVEHLESLRGFTETKRDAEKFLAMGREQALRAALLQAERERDALTNRVTALSHSLVAAIERAQQAERTAAALREALVKAHGYLTGDSVGGWHSMRSAIETLDAALAPTKER